MSDKKRDNSAVYTVIGIFGTAYMIIAALMFLAAYLT